MRFYVVTYVRRDRTTQLGATSAAEAIRAISSMHKDGWLVSRIERGTEAISIEELKGDAEQEGQRPPGI